MPRDRLVWAAHSLSKPWTFVRAATPSLLVGWGLRVICPRQGPGPSLWSSKESLTAPHPHPSESNTLTIETVWPDHREVGGLSRVALCVAKSKIGASFLAPSLAESSSSPTRWQTPLAPAHPAFPRAPGLCLLGDSVFQMSAGPLPSVHPLCSFSRWPAEILFIG